MTEVTLYFTVAAAVIWIITLLLPWQPWRVREVLDVPSEARDDYDLSDVTVLIPARNEAEVIATTLAGLKVQGQGLQVVLVDDASTDDTAGIARRSGIDNLQIVSVASLPAGWSGKLWAQEQGLQYVQTPLTLLLDADIELLPGIIHSLKQKRQAENLQFVSLMAVLRFASFWEKLLMPAFIHFFKMIYPFALANNPNTKIAAAAGGCILVDTKVLREIGGMAVIKDAVIDDCTLAKVVKHSGHNIWVGLTRAVLSQRPYVTLSEIWEMVARTAYTQLFYSTALLLLCTFIMGLMYIAPIAGLWVLHGVAFWSALAALVCMLIAYLPTLNFYGLNFAWAFSMPVIAVLYLLMTWTSAWRYWKGERSRWKGRVYQKD